MRIIKKYFPPYIILVTMGHFQGIFVPSYFKTELRLILIDIKKSLTCRGRGESKNDQFINFYSFDALKDILGKSGLFISLNQALTAERLTTC
jgi:hypothetical protein